LVKGVETLNEHQLIKEYFSDIGSGFLDEHDISISVGDDAAVFASPTGKDTVISVDTSIEGVHFLEYMHASDIAYRTVSIALSDLAACGALPAWFTLALSLNKFDAKWLSDFKIGLKDISNELKIPLIGGDTTKGNISITVQVGGYVDKGKALTRSGAKVGDSIYVTGCIGEASSELDRLKEEVSVKQTHAISSNSNRYTRPKIRFGVGSKLVGIASSAIDISDGLFQDLNHICKSSKVRAKIFLEKIPTFLDAGLSLKDFNRGDDYEIIFTSSHLNKDKIIKISQDEDIKISEIGVIEKGKEVEIISSEGNSLEVSPGYQHF
tara:strand:- start:907 stop:1875 length:969 start_codon:yes stop_codon:yes gene_type:complete